MLTYATTKKTTVNTKKKIVNFKKPKDRSRIIFEKRISEQSSETQLRELSTQRVTQQTQGKSSTPSHAQSRSNSLIVTQSTQYSKSVNAGTSQLNPHETGTSDDDYGTDTELVPIDRKTKSIMEHNNELIPIKTLFEMGNKGEFPKRVFSIGEFYN